MNGPFQVAQANIPVQPANAGRARIVKVAKPFSDQSIVVPLSYDGTVKADLSAIAGENITLVHIDEKLIILFDNKSTVTLEPFFDSAGKPLDAISVEVSPGRQLTGAEFAALFPVTEDQSVLPASGSGNAGGAQSSGANFSTVGIDPLAAPNPIDLLGQEELPTFVINNLLTQIFANDVPTALENAAEFLDEDELAGGNLGGISDFNAASNGPISITGVLAHDYGQDLAGSTLLLATGAPAGFVYTLSGNGTVLTVSQIQNGVSVDVLRMTLSDTTSGSYTLTQLHAIDHPAGGNENDVIFTFNYRVTDSNGDFDDGTLNLIVDDDTPVVTGNSGIRLDDDDVAGANGNAGGNGDDAAAPINVTGVLAHSYGADGAGSVRLLGTGAPAGFTYTLSGNGTVLTVSQIQDGISVDVLRLTLTDAVSGGYAITQLNAIHHAPVQGENDQGFVFSYRVTDHDGDTADGTITLNVNDDTPTIDVEAAQPRTGDEGNILPPFVLSLDESIGVDATDPDATHDDIAGKDTPDPTGVKPIGAVKTAAGGEGIEGGLQAMFNVAKSAGADGEQSTTYAYSFNLSNGSGGNTGVATSLYVTDAAGTLGDNRIYLFQVSATEIIGYVGNSTEGAIALRLTLTDAGSLSGAQLVVSQYMAIDHGIDFNDVDAALQLWLDGEGANLGVTLTATITDRDGDTATDSQTVEIIGSEYSAIEFQDDGPTLTGVQVVGGIVIDETNGVDADSDETTDPAVLALFAGVVNKGTDAQMSVQYASGKAGVIGFTVDFGTDGAKGGTAQAGTAFSLSVANNAVSGLSTSDGKEIHLFSENGIIVGRYDSNGDNAIDATDKAAFAITINPTTGIMSVAQFVSLSHPNAASQDEGISLNSGVLSVTVTVTDGDGDSASQSVDVGPTIRFEDDRPSLTGAVIERTVDEDDIDTAWSQGNHPGDGSADGSLTEGSTGAAIVSGTLSTLIKVGADDAGKFSFSSDAVAKLTALGLFSKETALGNGENGKSLIYNITVNGNETVITAHEPNPQGNPVFSLTVNTLTGAYEFRLFDELIHTAGDGENTMLRSGADGSIAGLDLGSIINFTDKDGDTVNLGGKFIIKITDDVPEAEIAIGRGSVTLDESAGNQADDTTSTSVRNLFKNLETSGVVGQDPDASGDNNGATAGNGAIAYARSDAAVVTNNSAIGADSPPYPHQYTLSISGGAFSGLYVTDGSPINLSVNADGLIIGTVVGGAFDGKVAFAIAIEADGRVSVAQYLSIKHDDRGDPNEDNDNGSDGNDASPNDTPNPIQQTLNGKIGVMLTVKDSDGDTATDTVNIGKLITFLDDGPRVSANAIVALEDDDLQGGIEGGTGDDNAPLNATGTLGHDYGADGPGKLLLTGTETLPNGFTWSLSANGLVLTISQGGKDVLKIELTNSTDGKYTVTQLNPIDHPAGNNENNLQFTVKYTVTDGDGDTANGTIKIDVDDDMPEPNFVLKSGALVTHDETSGNDGGNDSNTNFAALFVAVTTKGNDPDVNNGFEPAIGYAQSNGAVVAVTPNYGADGPGSTVFSIDVSGNSVFSGLYTTEGRPITLFEVNSGLIVGRYDVNGGNVTASDPAAFAIHIDPQTDVMTLVQYVSLKHPNTSNSDESVSIVNGAIRVTVTVTDHDGDSVNKTFDIGNKIVFEDDGPTVQVTVTAEANVVLQTQDADTIGTNSDTAVSTANFSNVFGVTSSFGVDGAGPNGGITSTYALSLAAGVAEGALSGLTSGGLGIRLYIDGNGVITGSTAGSEGGINNGNRIFQIEVSSNGTVKLTQFAQIDHLTTDPSPTGAPYADHVASLADGLVKLTRTVSVTDGDGDKASSSASIDLGGNIRFDDDGPKATATASKSIDEDDLAAGNHNTNSPGDDGAAAAVSITGQLGFTSGADAPATVGFAPLAGTVVVDGNGAAITSGGKALTYLWVADTNTLYATTNGTVGEAVFSIQVTNPSTGAYSFSLLKPLDHPGHDNPNTGGTQTAFEDNIALDLTYTVKDYDGDTATGKLSISIDDDMPTIVAAGILPTLTVDETSLTTAATQGFAANFTASYGADGQGSTTYALGVSASGANSGLVDTATGHAVLLTNNNGAIEGRTAGSDLLVFKLTVDASGNVTLIQQRAVMHGDPSDANDATTLSAANLVTLTATITDHDGDQATAVLNIGDKLTFRDDGPIAVADIDSVAAGSFAVATGNVITDAELDGGKDSQGADGAVVAGVAAGNTNADLVSAGTVGAVVAGAHGQLTLHADGSYSYARNPGSQGGVSDVFTYTLRDGDGDLSHTTLTIAIGDAAPTLNIPTAGGATTTVYEAGLPIRQNEPAGSNAAANTETTSETIGFTSVDGLQAVSLGGHLLTTVAQTFSDGLTASYSYDAATGIGTIDYSYKLPDNTLADPSSVSFAVMVTDADGDTAPAGDLVIRIVDDAPMASDEASQNVAEGATLTGMLDFVTGADGATVTHVNGTALAFNANEGGYSQAIDIGAGTIKVKADGSYSFTADGPVDNPVPVPVTATYTVTDGDGDTATANIAFAVTDANKPTGGTAAAAVDDDGLAGGNAASTTGDLNANAGDNAADTSEATFTGVLGGSVGGDAPGTFSFAALNGTSWTLGQESGTYSWNAVSNTLTANGPRGALLTVQVTNAATGAYKVTLLDNVLHAANSADEGATDPTLTLGYVIADSDGSTANGTLTITFDDDAPTAVAGPDLTLAETATATAGVNLMANDSQGADGARLTAVSFDGGTTWQTVSESGATAFTNANGKYVFQANGDWSFDPDVNASTSNTNGNFTYRITDGDGDTSTATQVVTITNTQMPLLLVGSNAGDTTGQTTDHTVANPQGQPDGVLQGGELDDTVVGDPGGVTLVAGDKANIVLVLDISSSMTDQISGVQRIEAMEDAVKALLTQLSQSGASDVRVHIVKFGITGAVVATYDVRSDGIAMSTTNLNAAHATIENLSNNLQDGTNYEAGLQQALAWINSTSGTAPLAGANVNKLLFISDGEPNYYNNGTTATEVSSFPNFNQQALNEITGSDGTNEVQLIENKGFVIEAVGISLSGTALTRLNTVEGANGVATSISTPAELSAVVGTLVGSTQSPNAVGNDTINGGAGADVTFGDVLNTDALAAQLGVNLPAGSGWAVFQTLENRANAETIDPAGNGADWTRADTIAYIRANHLTLSKESGRTGGHDVIDGGTGDDIIYGQEGNDTITGGDGNDIIAGGTGVDTMSGGAGNDTFRLANGEFAAGETINGGADTDTIVLTDATVVDFTAGTVTGIETVTGSIGNDNVTMSAQQWAAFNGIDLAGGTDVVNVRVNGSVDISTATLTSITAIETGNLTGTAGDDTITLRGNQLDAILIGAGTIDLGTGANVISLTSTSADLNGLSNAALTNVQTISAATAAAAVTINMANQSEALTLIGSSSNDTITGGSGADTITGGAGADTMNGGAGNDTFRLANGDFAAGETINGGNNTDTIVLTEATTVDFTAGTITNVENVSGSNGDDIVTLSAAQLAALSILDLGGGTDTLRINGSFSSSSNGQIAGVENIVLTAASVLNLSNQTEGFTITGSSGNDAITGGSGGDTYVLGLSGGVDTIQETGGTDTIRIQSNGAVLSGLNFENTSGENLVIKYNGQQATVTDHFASSSEAMETLAFTGGAMIGGYALGTGTYVLSTDDDSNRQASSGVNTILAGDSGGETLTGSSGNDLLFGNGGNDALSGGSGNDLLFGGTGTDTIDAGAGLDWIRYEERGTANQDVINNYNGVGSSKDVIDLSALLDAAFGPSSNVSDFVKVTDTGANALIQVDVTGSGNFTSAGNIATLTGYGTVGNTVSIYLEGLERQIQVVA